jgi:hypothetical protein
MSTANLPPDLVIQACESFIQNREAQILRERNGYIDARVGKRSWFGLGAPKTREQAEAESIDELYYIKIAGGYWHKKALELINLATVAKKCNTLVTVDAEIATVLKPYFG